MGTTKKTTPPIIHLRGNADTQKNLDPAAISQAYNAMLEALSDEERSLMQEMLQDITQGALPSMDPFHDLAEEYDLSVDAFDIENFLTVELGHCAAIGKVTKKMLATNLVLREDFIEKAIDRTLVGLCFTGIPDSGRKALRACARGAAEAFLNDIDLAIIEVPQANYLREALMDIFERFLLWMRIVRHSLDYASEAEERQFSKHLEKMNELLNLCHQLNEPPRTDAARLAELLKQGNASLKEYLSTLDGLEALMSSRWRARKIPAKGRVSDHPTLSRQGYMPSMYSYDLEVTLRETKPRIFRTLRIPGNRTLADLHRCLQDAFGWEDYHLHEFRYDHAIFGELSDDEERVIIADDIVSLDELRLKVGHKLEYIYDFGDDWVHSIRVKAREKLHGEEVWTSRCVCLDGAMAAPPEDCGGIEGYKELRAEASATLFASPTLRIRWAPDRFDKDTVNKKLARR